MMCDKQVEHKFWLSLQKNHFGYNRGNTRQPDKALPYGGAWAPWNMALAGGVIGVITGSILKA